MPRTEAILFDLGNTLVGYYELPAFPVILADGIDRVAGCLRSRALHQCSEETLHERVQVENHEAPDYRVRPLEERLQRIFDIDKAEEELVMQMCRAFMEPIFARATIYDDALLTLHELRSRGIRTAVVSNSPWGSPASLWVEEIERLGITPLLDAAVFCGDAGWRKPAPQIFELAMQRLDVTPDACLFVGDDPRWDVVGPQGVGIEAVLIDRGGTGSDGDVRRISTLRGLL